MNKNPFTPLIKIMTYGFIKNICIVKVTISRKFAVAITFFLPNLLIKEPPKIPAKKKPIYGDELAKLTIKCVKLN